MLSLLRLFLLIIFLPLSAGLLWGVEYTLDPDVTYKINESFTLKSKEKIYRKGEVLYCTGNSSIARANNEAALMIENREFEKGVLLIEKNLKNDALFFPLRYNLGVAYLYLEEFKKALVHFEKARLIVPEYSRTYLQIGFIYSIWKKENMSIDYYREAQKRNNKDLDTYILIGDIYYNRNQIDMAKKYYDASLRVNHRFPNGLLGRAKIHFIRGEYIKALFLLKSIDISGDYDRSYHYFYAECAFKLQDYRTASEHYEKMLKFRNDKFFLTNSPALIEHKLNLSRRFVD